MRAAASASTSLQVWFDFITHLLEDTIANILFLSFAVFIFGYSKNRRYSKLSTKNGREGGGRGKAVLE